MKRKGWLELTRRRFEANTIPTCPDQTHFRILSAPVDWEEYPDLKEQP